MIKQTMLVLAFAGAVGVAACEKAGEGIDSAVEKVVDGEKKPGDGPMEKAGEAIDKTIGVKRTDDPADDVHDALDGDKKTKAE